MSLLPTRTLGRTGLNVTQLSYGAMEVRGSRIWSGRPVEEKQAETILNAVLDSGINFIDTANCYGRSEEFIGKYLSHRRSEFFVATKCGCQQVRKDDATDETPHLWTRANLERGLAESLARMKTDYVDLMQLHNASPEQIADGGLLAVLQQMKAQGKVRAIGISSTHPHIEGYIAKGWFDSYQIPYSALERAHEGAISAAAQSGAGTIIRGGVARGEPGAGLGDTNRWAAFEKANLDELRAEGESRTAFLLRFTLSHPEMHTTIVGTLIPEHLQENVRIASQGPLPADVYAEAKKRLDAAA
jgi:aryl-alcohol dehydrogenase-like predicted oxidoreductase